ncbi:MAG: prepilin peptidase [Thermoguttaceae bacterium]|jgi:Flp pilus assembly protein protease CpaA
MSGLFSAPMTIVTVLVMAAAIFDVWTFRIPNLLTVPAMISALVYHAAAPPPASLASSLAGLCFGAGILFVLYLGGIMGAGDVKLMAAVGAWLGLPAVFHVFVISAMATGVYSVALLAWDRGIRRTLALFYAQLAQLPIGGVRPATDASIADAVRAPDRRKRLVPFAAMVAFGVIVLGLFPDW